MQDSFSYWSSFCLVNESTDGFACLTVSFQSSVISTFLYFDCPKNYTNEPHSCLQQSHRWTTLHWRECQQKYNCVTLSIGTAWIEWLRGVKLSGWRFCAVCPWACPKSKLQGQFWRNRVLRDCVAWDDLSCWEAVFVYRGGTLPGAVICYRV